jgi:hypothetical protein
MGGSLVYGRMAPERPDRTRDVGTGLEKPVPPSVIEQCIFVLRGHKVMVDRDLAELYEVPTKSLNQSVKRNQERFPDGFMFRLTAEETKELVTKCDRFASLKHATSFPLAFTEFGVAMLSSVLHSRRAANINVQIIQTFIRLREFALTHEEFARRLSALEGTVGSHGAHIGRIFKAIRALMNPPEKPVPKIGFHP